MSKGKETKEKILRQSAELFNQRGYAGVSISDIMQVTGLQKGGIYNHFQSKDELALQAFDYAIAQMTKHYRTVLRSKSHAIERLQAIIEAFYCNTQNPAIRGGCPLLNTAVESDDTHPALRERAQQAINSWRNLICRIIAQGIENGEIHSTLEADEVATILIATLEGAVMMSHLYKDLIYLERAVKHLKSYITHYLQVEKNHE